MVERSGPEERFPPPRAEAVERRGLRLSAAGALAMALLGIAFFFVTDSSAVLLDGLFSLVGFVMGLLGLRVATLVQKPDDECFHFGYAAFEPMLNLAKGLLIAFVTLFASISAVGVILDGGHQIRGAMAVVYAVTAAAGCLVIAVIQQRAARATGSPLLHVDSKNWLVDGILSAAVAVAFLLVVLLGNGPLAPFAPYADPAVVLVLSVLSAPIPVRIVRDNWRQLLGRAPGPDLLAEAQKRVRRAFGEHAGMTPRLRALQMGRMVYLQVYVLVDPQLPDPALGEIDQIREKIFTEMVRGASDIGLDIIFTRQPRWVGRSVGRT